MVRRAFRGAFCADELDDIYAGAWVGTLRALAGRQGAAADQDRVGIARQEQHPQARPRPQQQRRQVAAAQPRHHHVGHQQVDAVGMGRRHPQRLLAVGGLQHRVAGRLQGPAHQAADDAVVLGHQHRLRPGQGARRRHPRLRRPLGLRQR